jgi:hypothetical protein
MSYFCSAERKRKTQKYDSVSSGASQIERQEHENTANDHFIVLSPCGTAGTNLCRIFVWRTKPKIPHETNQPP